MQPRKIGYARVSTQDQDLSAQNAALRAAGCTLIFEEKISGTKASREQLNAMIDQLIPGDTIIITKLDRLGRSLINLLKLIELFKQKGVNLVSLNDNLDTSSAMGKFIFQLFGALAELERNIISERTTAGVRFAKSQGRLPGRKPLAKDIVQTVLYRVNAGDTYASIAKDLNISVKSVQRIIKKSTLNAYATHA